MMLCLRAGSSRQDQSWPPSRRPSVAHAVHNGITGIPAIPASHAFIHGDKVAFGLLTQLVLEGRPQAEIEEIYRYQKAVVLPITLAERTVIPGESSHNEPFPVTADALISVLRAAVKLKAMRLPLEALK